MNNAQGQIQALAKEPVESASARALAIRFVGYLSADGLNYALGFLIYGLLVRVLTNGQYGELSIATTIYQALMMIVALGLDLTGPAMLAKTGGDPMAFVARAQRIRLAIAGLVCGPIHIVCALYAWHHGRNQLAGLLLVSFSMVLARALDLTYAAVAFRMPGPLAKTRAFGLFVYLLLLLVSIPILHAHLWLIPCLNALGVTLGRIQLGRFLRRRSLPQQRADEVRAGEIISQGIRASVGQLLLLVLQTMDILLLAKYVSSDALGQYGMVSRLYLLGTAVLTCLLNAFLPELVAVTQTSTFGKHFRRFVLASLTLGVCGGAAFYGLGAGVAELLAHRPLSLFRAISPVFALVFLLMGVANPFLSILPSIGRPTVYVAGIASAAMLLLVCDLSLIPKFGALGGAWGQVIATGYLGVFSVLQVVRTRYVGLRQTARTHDAGASGPLAIGSQP